MKNINLPRVLSNLPALSSATLDLYLQQVNKLPFLSKEEGYDLAVSMHEHQDLQAAQTLVLSHLRYVIKVAKGYIGYGLQLADLIQEGAIGLMKAVKRFNPYKEVRLVTFAMHWIKAEIHEFIFKNWRIVKIATTKAQRKLFFKLKAKKQTQNWLTQLEAHEIAQDLGVATHEVLQMEARLFAADLPFDKSAFSEAEENSIPSYYLEQADSDPADLHLQTLNKSQLSQNLQICLNQLDLRSRDIIQSRWLNEEQKLTLDELASKYAISKERVRQLETKALAYLGQNLVNQ